MARKKSKRGKAQKEKENILNIMEKYKIAKVMKGKFDDGMNRRLRISIPGKPISDSRPRVLSTHSYNPNKEKLMKIFRSIYKEDDIIKKACIMSPSFVKIKAYIKPDKATIKAFGKTAIEKELVKCVKIKDNDNIEKVHWDVLQDPEFAVVLNDAYITDNITRKRYSYNERVDIEIDYYEEDAFLQEYKNMVQESSIYRKFLFSKKNIFDILNTSDKDFAKVYWNIVIDTYRNLGLKEKEFKTFMKRYYTTREIDRLLKEGVGRIVNGDIAIRIGELWEEIKYVSSLN